MHGSAAGLRDRLAVVLCAALVLTFASAAIGQQPDASSGPASVFGALFGVDTGLPDPVRFGVRIEAGDIEQARAWLDAGLPPDFVADRVGTGLMIGAWEGNIPMMELFLSRGADIHARNRHGEQALMHAAWRGHLPAVRWLIERGARVANEPMRWTALHYAAFAGQRDVAAYLLEQGAEINARAPNGSTVLMMSVYEGREDLVRMLLEHGADPAIRNDRGDRALEWAMRFNRLRIARLVAPSEEFVAAANAPKESWGAPIRSEPLPSAPAVQEAALPDEVERLLSVREALAKRGLSLDRVEREIAAARVQRVRALRAAGGDVPRPAVLEITARRSAPGEQDARLIVEPSPPQP